MTKRFLALMLAACTVFGCMIGCNKADGDKEKNPGDKVKTGEKYEGPYSALDGTYGGIDDLGRELPLDTDVSDEREGKTVGIFYFLWHGEHGTGGPYDNYKIVLEHPDAIESEKKWQSYGGGPQGAMSYWGEPLFGYYFASDKWVLRKHLQMLTDAGIDYLVMDTTNNVDYAARTKDVIEVWYEYLEKGYDVPKLSFYTNTNSGDTIMKIYKNIYNNKKLNEKYPRLSELWFQWDGKPMIIGIKSDSKLTEEVKNYFRIKESVWPNGPRNDDGFPWMEFGRLLSDDAVYGLDGRKEVVNVSIAQHDETCTMSYSAWYGSNDRTRSWHNGANDTSENAMYYGYNVAEQWEWALSVDPETVFFTGWNEWTAQRQPPREGHAVVFVDNADPNTSRDAEPMRGLFGDNYYIQLMNYIRQYKGTARRVYIGDSQTIDIGGDFSQWEAAGITARYTDYSNDTVDRKGKGYGNVKYTNTTGRNDFTLARAAYDADNIYFFAQTAEDITASTDDNWMTLFISSGNADTAKWVGKFDYAVNLVKPDGNAVIISKYNADGTWSEAGRGTMKVEGNKIMLNVPRNILGIGANDLINIEFKWADNYQKDENGNLDVFSFYEDGDAAPMGRLTYVFSEAK